MDILFKIFCLLIKTFTNLQQKYYTSYRKKVAYFRLNSQIVTVSHKTAQKPYPTHPRAVARQNLLGGPSSVAEQQQIIHIQDVEQFSF